MNILVATSKHLKDCVAINTEFQNEYSHPHWFLQESIEHKRVLGAEKDEKIVGYLLYQILWGNTPFLALIKVTRAFQKKGIGESLEKALLEKLKTEGYHKIISSTETINNAGRLFHEKNHFIPLGELKMIYGNEIFYEKDF